MTRHFNVIAVVTQELMRDPVALGSYLSSVRPHDDEAYTRCVVRRLRVPFRNRDNWARDDDDSVVLRIEGVAEQ